MTQKVDGADETARLTFIYFDYPNQRWRTEFQVGKEQVTFAVASKTSKWYIVGHPETVISPELRECLSCLVNDALGDWYKLRDYRMAVGELPPGITLQ